MLADLLCPSNSLPAAIDPENPVAFPDWLELDNVTVSDGLSAALSSNNVIVLVAVPPGTTVLYTYNAFAMQSGTKSPVAVEPNVSNPKPA